MDRRVVVAGVFTALTPGLAFGASQQTPRAAPGRGSDQAPQRRNAQPLSPNLDQLQNVPLTRPGGGRTTFAAVLASAPTVISFWATWCGPCVAEARYLSGLRRRIPAAQLNIVGVNVDDEPRDEQEIARFLARVGANYTQLRGNTATLQAFDRGPRLAIPRLYIFDASGRATDAFAGFDGMPQPIDRAVERVMAAT